MIEFIIVDINNHKWKNTVWTDRIVEIEIGHLNISERERIRSILINGKTLGLIALEKIVLPIGCKLFANIEVCEGRLKIRAIDKPDLWIANIRDSKYNCFSDEFLDICWQENDNSDDAGEVRLERIKDEASPHFFYEWIIRMGLDDRYISKETIDRYLTFRDFLYTVIKLNEFTYGDDEIQRYINDFNGLHKDEFKTLTEDDRSEIQF